MDRIWGDGSVCWDICSCTVLMVESEGQRQEQPFTYLQFGSHRLEPPFQFAYVLAEQCDTVVTGAHPLFHCFKTVNRIASRLPRQIQSLQHVTVNLELSVSDLSDGWQRYGPGFPQVLPLSHTESVSPVQQFSFTATRRLVGCGLTQQRPIAPRYRPTRLSCSRYGPGSPKRPLSPISSGGHSFWPVHILQMCDVVMKCDVKKSQN